MTIPQEIKNILSELKSAGFDAYIVGGSVRNFLLKKEPKDWDITTNAKPEEIQKIFPDSFYENDFGTVSVKPKKDSLILECVEITPFRIESDYKDNRHPENIKWADNLEDDLSRRDFTINAMAMDLAGKIVDPFNGKKDLESKIVKCVGEAEVRFDEDALRLMRAIRFATVLQFKIETKTKQAIIKKSALLKNISQERIRDELVKIMQSDYAHDGIEMLRELELLQYIIPELLEGFGVGQNKHHKFEIYEHNLKTLEYSTKKKFGFDVKMASLLHDVAKPKTKQGDGLNSTFYNHEIVGAKMTKNILTRLKFSKKDIDRISLLVRYHLFYYNVGEVTEASIRRLVKNVGIENIDDLINLRMADRIGSGCPKAEPYKLRHLKYLIDRVCQDPINAKMLKINGNDLMNLGIPASKKMGDILDILLARALNDPRINTKEILETMAKELNSLSESEIAGIANKAEAEINKVETKQDDMTKKKYWVS
jgi:tRNA nucleotidyltransferase/poly(A) polymerase